MWLSPPGNLTDFDRAADPVDLRNAWEALIGNQMNDRALDTRRFFHPLKPPSNRPVIEADPITWTGFPRAIELFVGAVEDPSKLPEAFRIAEVLQPIYYVVLDGRLQIVRNRQVFPLGPKPWRGGSADLSANDVMLHERQQDEYLEWHVTRKNGKIERIMFTAEGPEYWRTLARDPQLLTALYNDLLFDGRPVVAEKDLYWPYDLALPSYTTLELNNGRTEIIINRDNDGNPVYLRFSTKDSYNQFNKWNTTEGCVHLIQRNNSLGAEINLAADATYDYGSPDEFSDAEAFMTCAAIGGIRRNSDPNIARDANLAVATGLAITIADPVGLYISEFVSSGITHNGTDVTADVVAGVRGSRGGSRQRVVRFELRAPQDGTFTLDECFFDGQPITSGGPFARTTSISIYADAQQSERENLKEVCAASFLCEHPDRPGFKHYPRNGGCAQVPWTALEPYTGGDGIPASAAGAVTGVVADGFARTMGPEMLARPETRRDEPGT